MPPNEQKERRVDAGAILELAAEVRALAVAVEHDRQDRQRERTEDRATLKEWREGQERRLEKLESLQQEFSTRVTVLEAAVPEDLSSKVAAADALRRSLRFWLRAVGSAAVALLVSGIAGLWLAVKKGVTP